MGGFSAGAVTALHVAYRSDDPGDVGDHDSVDSRVQAALSASGCNYMPESIGPGDAPVHLLHAEFDFFVPFSCAQDVARRAQAAGLVAQTLFFSERSCPRRLAVRHPQGAGGRGLDGVPGRAAPPRLNRHSCRW